MVPKNDRIYSEYFDWSENSDGSEISGSKYSDDGGSAGIRIQIFTLVSISGHRYANDMIKSVLERWKFWYFFYGSLQKNTGTGDFKFS